MSGPMDASVLLVVGNMRCGSSLVMRMLGAAGVPLLYTHAESFEHEGYLRMLEGNGLSRTWLRPGHAVKWLDPLLHGWPPPTFTYRAVVLTRDPTEQARSQQQFLGALARISMNRSGVRDLARGLRRDNARLADALGRALPGTPVLSSTFEALIEYPTESAADLARFVGLPEAATVMARQIKRRTAQCHRGLMELELADDPTLWHGAPTG